MTDDADRQNDLVGTSMFSVMRKEVRYHKRTAEASQSLVDETAEREKDETLDDWAGVNHTQFSSDLAVHDLVMFTSDVFIKLYATLVDVACLTIRPTCWLMG